ncbi:MAG TPA: glycosyltransferase [Thermoanaerobaculia bacterium]|nr:glycosyltransferase [Thermoanaerobaculia bacterium]
MRLLHVVPTYLPATRYGGPIVAVHGLCKALAARGHEVHVFTTNVDGPGVSEVPLDRPVELDGVQVHYFPSSFPRLYWSPPMGRALRDVHAFDVVHLHSVFLWPTTAAARAAHGRGVPYLIAPRGMLVPELIRRKSRAVKTAWLQLVERRNFKNAAAIHFTSHRELQDAQHVHLPIPHPAVVPNGIELVPRPGVTRDENTIAFLGRINWKKGLDRLIDALPDGARLEIAGNDEENLTPALRKRAEGKDVVFLGPLHGQAKWELLARAAIFALPSLSENFGNAVVEAMMMETPVVLSPEVGLAEHVAFANAGVMADDFRAALTSLLRDPALRAQLGRNGRALVERELTWPRVAAQMEEVYERCSSTSRR